MAKRPRQIQQADIRLLRVFQTIAQAGGLSAAELILNVGRSTISRQLTDLELRLGIKLCDRGPGGFALTEEMVWEDLRLANPTLMDYKVPTCLDAPHAIHPIIVENAEPDGPFGAKGVGEIGINAVAPAIANAIAAATGARLRRLPLTPERVLRATLEEPDET